MYRKLEELKTEIAKEKNKFKDLKSKCELYENEINSFESRKRLIEESCAKTETTEQASIKRMISLRQEYLSVEGDLETLRLEKDKLENDVGELQMEKNELKKQIVAVGQIERIGVNRGSKNYNKKIEEVRMETQQTLRDQERYRKASGQKEIVYPNRSA